MVIGLAILATVGAFHLGIREYNKRLAKKDGYDILEHDKLWRPLNRKGGKRLNKKEARSLAKIKRRELMENFMVTEEYKIEENITVPRWFDKDNDDLRGRSSEPSSDYSIKKDFIAQ